MVHDERGETLVELLVTVVVLGLTGVALVAGLTTAVMISDSHRKAADAGATIRDYAEAIETAVVTSGYQVSCAPTYAADFTPPSGYTTPAITAVSFWNGAGFPGTCDPTADTGLQRLTLRVSSMDGRAAESLTIVVRNPCGTGTLCA